MFPSKKKAPLITKEELQQWSYSKKILLLSYSAHLKIDVHYSLKVKKKNIILFSVHTRLEYFILFFLSPSSPFLPVAPLSPQSVLTLFISSRRKVQLLYSPPTQALAQHRPCWLISSSSTPISLLSHFSSTLSFNLSPSQTPRPMLASAGFWFCCRDWQNDVVAMTGFYVDGLYFYFDEWVLILLMVDEWDCWWLMNGGWVSLVSWLMVSWVSPSLCWWLICAVVFG